MNIFFNLISKVIHPIKYTNLFNLVILIYKETKLDTVVVINCKKAKVKDIYKRTAVFQDKSYVSSIYVDIERVARRRVICPRLRRQPIIVLLYTVIEAIVL